MTPRAAFGVTPQGAMQVARQSRFHRIPGRGTCFGGIFSRLDDHACDFFPA